jgi:hypothetical protein
MRVYTGQGRAAGAAVLRRVQVSGSGARTLSINDDPCSRFRARGGHSVGTRFPPSSLPEKRPNLYL